VPDGHCGYRAIAISLGRPEDEWKSVREDLIAEMESKHDMYEAHFEARQRGDGGVAEHVSVIRTTREEVLDTPALWLNSAQMLYIIATTYKRPFCVYGEANDSFSALPLDGAPNDNTPIFLCYDRKGLHFLSLSLFSSQLIPFPNVWQEWFKLCKPDAANWMNKHQAHFNKFQKCIRPLLVAENPWPYGSRDSVSISDSD
jgi:hypothetical protein